MPVEVIGRKLRLTAYLEEERHEVMLEPGMISENMLFLRQAILAGLGIGIVPDYLIRDDLQRGDVVTMLEEWRLSIFGTRMYLLYMPNLHHTRATSTLIEFILQRARAEALAGSHKTAAVPSARAPIEARQPD